ncbi:MAG TPA: META domain-containing protein [Phycisphaerales bacterium]|mgnify:CR=1 FL=1|nr:META domain-containing protein [Phycisphaerales bacterium]HMP38194.1 META domain-containing protein [Phycisphaerales bacterium]
MIDLIDSTSRMATGQRANGGVAAPDRPRRRRPRGPGALAALGLASLLLLSAGACERSTSPGTTGGGGATATGPIVRTPTRAAIFGEWFVLMIEGEPLAIPADARVPTLSFGEDDRFISFAGVNQLSGAADLSKLEEGSITFLPGPMTLMAGPPELMELESRFVERLRDVKSVSIEDEELVLSGESGELLRFRRSG